MEFLNNINTINTLPKINQKGSFQQLPSLPTLSTLPTINGNPMRSYKPKSNSTDSYKEKLNSLDNPYQVNSIADVISKDLSDVLTGNIKAAFIDNKLDFLKYTTVDAIKEGGAKTFAERNWHALSETVDFAAGIVKSIAPATITTNGFDNSDDTLFERVYDSLGHYDENGNFKRTNRYYDFHFGNWAGHNLVETIAETALDIASDPFTIASFVTKGVTLAKAGSTIYNPLRTSDPVLAEFIRTHKSAFTKNVVQPLMYGNTDSLVRGSDKFLKMYYNMYFPWAGTKNVSGVFDLAPNNSIPSEFLKYFSNKYTKFTEGLLEMQNAMRGMSVDRVSAHAINAAFSEALSFQKANLMVNKIDRTIC